MKKENQIILTVVVMSLLICGVFLFNKNQNSVEPQSTNTPITSVLGNNTNPQQVEIDSLKSQVQALKKNTVSPQENINPINSDFNLQTKCADEAHTSFVELAPSESNTSTSSYTNHFNQKLGKCFILINTMTGEVEIYTLYDAISKQEYGEFSWNMITDKTSMINCTTQNNTPTDCEANTSAISWNDLKKPYMED